MIESFILNSIKNKIIAFFVTAIAALDARYHLINNKRLKTFSMILVVNIVLKKGK
jgi:hypothetical protein